MAQLYLFDLFFVIIVEIQILKTEVTNLPKPTKKFKSSSPGWFYLNVGLRVVYSVLLVGVSLLLFAGALGAGIGIGYFTYLVEDIKLPNKKEFQQDLGDLTQTSKIVYADNSLVSTIQSDLLRTNVKHEEISPLIMTAIVATEDEYFYEHNGIVPKAVLRALASEVTGFGSSGGSTLTQQLVKQQILTSETTFERKANELILATEIEKHFSKEEIITMYLNVSPFGRNNRGQNIAGVKEATLGIFGLQPDKVNLPQAAFIAGLPQSPIVYSPFTNTGALKEEADLSYGLKRKDFILFSMYRNHDISKKEYEEALAYDLVADFRKQESATKNTQDYLYQAIMAEASKIVAKKLADEDKITAEKFAEEETNLLYMDKAHTKLANGGYTVKSTIDKTVYNAMQKAVADYGSYLDNWSGAKIEVGNVLMDNKTGKVIGFVGGREYKNNPYNHAFSSHRQAGSAIKPALVYAPAIDQGIIGSETRVSDYPTNWGNGEDAGKPIVNAINTGSKTFRTVREALDQSDNIPAYHIYQALWDHMGSASAVYDQYLSKMNFPNVPTWQYESAPLGVAEVTTLEQTNGFQTIANNGVYHEGYVIESIIDSEGKAYYQHEAKPVQVFSKAAASITTDLLRTALNRGLTTNFTSQLSNLDWNLGNLDWIGKTGTTDFNVDSWLVASTPTITLSSWSGREDSKPSDEGAGQRTATYMAYLANAIYQAKPEIMGAGQSFKLDPSVRQDTVSKFTGVKPGGTMTIDNITFNSPSETVTSYWAKNGPADLSFRFGIGGTDANYADYWRKVVPKPKPKPKPETPKKDENKDDKKDEEKDDEKEETKPEDKEDEKETP